MKTGMTLSELGQELQRQRAAARDFKAPTTRLSYLTGGTIGLLDASGHAPADRQFGTSPLFQSQLATWAGIPKKYVDMMAADAPELLATNLNHWLSRNDETRLVRTMDGQARAFLSHRYRVLDNVDVVSAVMPTLVSRGVEFVSQAVTPDHLYLKAVSKKKTYEVRKGDKVQFGVTISNSEVGLGAVHVDPFILTLACLNGATVAASGLRKFHIGRKTEELAESVEVFKDDTRAADDKAFFLKLRDVVEASFDEAEMTEVLNAAQAGATRRLGQGRKIEEVIEVTAKRYGLNDTEADGVLRRLIDGGDLTQWGLSSALTNYAQADELTYERASELERVGGAVAVMAEEDWAEVAR